MSLCLQARQLACERDDRWLFEGLDLDIQSGEIVRIEGPNGSGKTTLLKILSGQLTDYRGELYWNGEPMRQAREHFLANLLYLGHAPGVKAGLSPLENLAWYQALSGEKGSEPAREAAVCRATAACGAGAFDPDPAGAVGARRAFHRNRSPRGGGARGTVGGACTVWRLRSGHHPPRVDRVTCA